MKSESGAVSKNTAGQGILRGLKGAAALFGAPVGAAIQAASTTDVCAKPAGSPQEEESHWAIHDLLALEHVALGGSGVPPAALLYIHSLFVCALASLCGIEGCRSPAPACRFAQPRSCFAPTRRSAMSKKRPRITSSGRG